MKRKASKGKATKGKAAKRKAIKGKAAKGKATNWKAPFCDTCKEIALLIDDYYKYQKAKFNKDSGLAFRRRELNFNDRTISLGTWKDLQSRIECRSCQDIARTTRSLLHDGEEHPAQVGLEFTCTLNPGWPGLRMDIRGASSLEYLGLRRLELPNKAHEVGRLINPHQVNVELLRQWIHCCHTSHRGHCLKIEIPTPLSLIYLVDAVEGCLVLANIETKYVALSYVWGNSVTFKTTKEKLIHLMTSRGLDAYVSKLGKTIEDALRLVVLLGERYLWVDCLCIVQDDLDTKQDFLNAMGSIYANAYFTIVAAEGKDGDHGLRGLGYGSQNRIVDCNIIRFPFETNVVTYELEGWYPVDTPWESRAWTFQEAYFSRRLLIFNGMVTWFCRAAVWEEHVNQPSEDVAYSPVANDRTFGIFADLGPTWPNLTMWDNLVQDFNTRKLTFDEDAMDASAGMTSIFDRKFSGGILWGIPEMFFDYRIVWKPRKVLRRRRAYNHALLADSFPSWSWVAWEGPIFYVNSSPILSDKYERYNQCIQIQSMAQWYKSREPTSSLYPVKNIDHALRLHRAEFKAQQLPTGWTQGQYPNGTPHFTHETVPDMRFRYPIPLKNESAGPSINGNGRYLHFKTQRTRLFLGREIIKGYNHEICIACLSDIEGKWAGSIRLNTARYDSLPRDLSFELIALSLAKADNNVEFIFVDEWDIPERPRDSDFYHFYYVMWVEWYAGIAHRKAIGTVYKPVWDRQVREDIDVVLG